MTEKTAEDQIREFFAQYGAQQELAGAFVAMLRRERKRSSHLALTYRCKTRRCVLLELYRTKQGLVVRYPPYKLSRRVNTETSSEGGRAKNTSDGDRHWVEQVGFFPEVGDVAGDRYIALPMNCDHVRSTIRPRTVLDDLERGDTEVAFPR